MIRLAPLALAVALVAAQEPPAKPETAVVARGTLVLAVDAEGTFDAVDPLEVRLRPRAYAGPFTVRSAAAHGAAVRQGTTILEIDPAPLRRQLAAAESDHAFALAALAKAEKEEPLQSESDALLLSASERGLKNAESSLSYWEKIDGPHLLRKIEQGLQYYRDSIRDQELELDQLRKMYKSEELTNETSEIVVQRAVRQLERTREEFRMQEETAAKRRELEVPNARRAVEDAVAHARLHLALLRNAQALSRASREAERFKAKAAVAALEERVADLRGELETLTVRAPFDGVVLYGQLQQGAWVNNSPRTLRTGENVQPLQVLMTVFRPGHLFVQIDLPEALFFRAGRDLKARVIPSSTPGQGIEGTTRAPETAGVTKGAGQVFAWAIDLPAVDGHLVPGMKAAVHVELGEVKDVLLVPLTAVSKGRVWLASGEERPVVVGENDGLKVEIKSGLREGEVVLAKAKK